MSNHPCTTAPSCRRLLGLALLLSLAGAADAAVHTEAHSKAAAGPDSPTIVVITCLIAVPPITAALAFVLVESQLPKDQDGVARTPAERERHSMPRPAEHGRGPQQEPSLSITRASLPSGASVQGSASALLQSSQPSSGVFYGGSRPATAFTQPPSLPLLSSPVLSSPASQAILNPPESQASLPRRPPGRDTTQPTAFPAPKAEPRASPLSTALLVKNPDGVLVRLEGELLPHPERRTVNVTSIRDANTILCAHVSEMRVDDAWIRVETKAKNIPIATLDTRTAIFPKNGIRPSMERRRVVLHRVGGEGDGEVGPACAYVVPAGQRKFQMVFIAENGAGALAMTLHTAVGGVHIERILNAEGLILAKSESMWQPSGNPGPPALWVREGTDMALVACAMLAVQKLADGVDEYQPQGREVVSFDSLLSSPGPAY